MTAIPGLFLYLLAIVISAGLVAALGASVLGWLQAHGCRQYIREEGPQRHQSEAGTPTMGGIIFIPPILLVGLGIPLISRQWHMSLLLLAGLTLVFMLMGLTDDLMMLKRKNNLGLKARQKLTLQFLFAALFIYLLRPEHPFLRLPFSLYLLQLPIWAYYVFAILFIVLASNSTNLSDGLDGLLAGLCIIAAGALAFAAHWRGDFAPALFACALAGGCLGFLFYNRHPARVFMGDTGSLALGAALAGSAILLHFELLFLLFGAVFFLESLSVIIQVLVFKSTGRRVFKMSPLHHHFELSGWKETRVVKVFWAASAALAALTLFGTHLGWRP